MLFLVFWYNFTLMKQVSFIHMKSIIVFCMVAVSIPFIAKADLFDQLVIAIKAGDSKQVSQYFNKTVDFATPTLSDVYSKAQAEILLKDFLSITLPRYSPFNTGVHLHKEPNMLLVNTITTKVA